MQPLEKFSLENSSGSPAGPARELVGRDGVTPAQREQRGVGLAGQGRGARGEIRLERDATLANAVALAPGELHHRDRLQPVAPPPRPQPLAEQLDGPLVVIGHENGAGCRHAGLHREIEGQRHHRIGVVVDLARRGLQAFLGRVPCLHEGVAGDIDIADAHDDLARRAGEECGTPVDAAVVARLFEDRLQFRAQGGG